MFLLTSWGKKKGLSRTEDLIMFIFQTRTTFFSDCCLFWRAYLISSGQRCLVLASLWRIVLMGGSPFCLPFACARHHECTFERALLPKGSTSCRWCAHGGGTQRGVAERQEDTNHGGLAGTVNTDVNSTDSEPFFWREGINNTFVRARGDARCVLVCVRMDVNMTLIARNFTGAPFNM